jgi:hypothetical protein
LQARIDRRARDAGFVIGTLGKGQFRGEHG